MDPKRLARIRAVAQDGASRRGTGYLVADDLVLTATHVVLSPKVDGTQQPLPEVRLLESRSWTTASVAWRPRSLDACLLRVHPSRCDGTVNWGRWNRDRRLEWNTAAFLGPAYHEPDTFDLSGFIGPGGSLEADDLELTVHSPPRTLDDLGGASGAPVFVGHHLLGVIRSGRRIFDGGRIYATPVEKLLAFRAFCELVGASESALVVPDGAMPSSVLDLQSTSAVVADRPPQDDLERELSNVRRQIRQRLENVAVIEETISSHVDSSTVPLQVRKSLRENGRALEELRNREAVLRATLRSSIAEDGR